MRFLTIVGLAVLFGACRPTVPPTPASEDAAAPVGPQLQAVLDEQARAFVDDPVLHAVSVGVYRAGQMVTSHQGQLDVGEGNPPTDDTLYPIASVTKTFTGTLMAQAVIDGKIGLDDEVRALLDGDYDNLQFAGEPMRVRHLVTHTSGLPTFLPTSVQTLLDADPDDLVEQLTAALEGYRKADFLEDLRTVTLSEPPGRAYRYSNAGAELATHLLERAYGQPYATLLQQTVLSRAKMASTFLVDDVLADPRLVTGHGLRGAPVPEPHIDDLWGGAGGLASSTTDLLRYARYQLESSDPAVVASHQVLYDDGQGERMGYFWPIQSDEVDGTYLLHHGGTAGAQGFLVVLPEHAMGLVILTNQSDKTTAGKLLKTLDAILDRIRP